MSEFFSALVAAIIALAGQHLLNHFDRKKAARYLAIRTVCIFDKYLADCTEVVSDSGEPDQDGFTYPSVTLPHVPTFPDDVDWKSIDHPLMYDILSFPSDVVAANEAISHDWDMNYDPPDFSDNFEYRAKHYARLGLQAHALAKRLRTTYDIRDKVYDGWNPASYLEEKLKEIEERQERRYKNLPPMPPVAAPEKVEE